MLIKTALEIEQSVNPDEKCDMQESILMAIAEIRGMVGGGAHHILSALMVSDIIEYNAKSDSEKLIFLADRVAENFSLIEEGEALDMAS